MKINGRKPVWRFLKNEIALPYNPVITLLGIYPKEHKTGFRCAYQYSLPYYSH
jgi:hypothetical protein